jgi:hypothetical protein
VERPNRWPTLSNDMKKLAPTISLPNSPRPLCLPLNVLRKLFAFIGVKNDDERVEYSF